MSENQGAWAEIRSWARGQAGFKELGADHFRISVELGTSRQPLTVSLAQADGEAWLEIFAEVSRLADLRLVEALGRVAPYLVGMVSLRGSTLGVRHVHPLPGTSARRLETIVQQLAMAAVDLRNHTSSRSLGGVAFVHYAD